MNIIKQEEKIHLSIFVWTILKSEQKKEEKKESNEILIKYKKDYFSKGHGSGVHDAFCWLIMDGQ